MARHSYSLSIEQSLDRIVATMNSRLERIAEGEGRGNPPGLDGKQRGRRRIFIRDANRDQKFEVSR